MTLFDWWDKHIAIGTILAFLVVAVGFGLIDAIARRGKS